MKQLLFFLLFSISIQSQDFSRVDNLVVKYPNFSKVEELSNQIKKDFTTDDEKVRAAFYWLVNNIRYNLKEYYNPRQRSYNFSYSTEIEKKQKLQDLKDKIVANAFRKKLGVCEEYAQSFKKICDLLGVEATVIKGNVRNAPQEIGRPQNTTNHAWNGVKINGKWLILDATWAAGYEQNGLWKKHFDNYFYDIPKGKILKTHYPEDSLWMLRFERMSLKAFYNQPIYGKTFLNSETELIAPKNGILKLNAKNQVVVKFKKLDIKKPIFYALKGKPLAKKPIILIEGNLITLTFNNVTRNSYLYLFINKEIALQFKTQ